MPDMNDFHAFQNTSGGNNGIGGTGCSGGCLTWILVGLAFLWIVGKLFT